MLLEENRKSLAFTACDDQIHLHPCASVRVGRRNSSGTNSVNWACAAQNPQANYCEEFTQFASINTPGARVKRLLLRPRRKKSVGTGYKECAGSSTRSGGGG